jgi:DNA-binding transcriptional LysR family regulator
MGHDVAGLVRFSAASDGTGWLTGIVAEFLRRYPKVQLDVILTPRRVDLLAEGVDIALRAGRLADSSLVARRLGSSDLGLFASRGYLRRAGTPKRVSDLAKHDFVLYGLAADRNTVRLNGPRGLETVKVQGPLSVNEMSFAGEAVARGVGIGLIPVLFFRPGATPRRHVVRVLPEYAVTGVDVNLVSPPTAYEPARVALFRDFLAEQLGPRVKACEAAQHEETARALGRAADGRRAPSRPAR